jgi:hypothetical protein
LNGLAIQAFSWLEWGCSGSQPSAPCHCVELVALSIFSYFLTFPMSGERTRIFFSRQ